MNAQGLNYPVKDSDSEWCSSKKNIISYLIVINKSAICLLDLFFFPLELAGIEDGSHETEPFDDL